MVIIQLCECRCVVDERNTWLSICGLWRRTVTAPNTPACVILCFLFYLIFFQVFCFYSCISTSKLPLFIYFYFSYVFIFHKTERNPVAHEASCLCLPFHLSMLSARLIYDHLFWQTRTRCRTRSETTPEQL